MNIKELASDLGLEEAKLTESNRLSFGLQPSIEIPES